MLPPSSPPVIWRPCTPFQRFVHRKHNQKHAGVNLAIFQLDGRIFSDCFFNANTRMRMNKQSYDFCRFFVATARQCHIVSSPNDPLHLVKLASRAQSTPHGPQPGPALALWRRNWSPACPAAEGTRKDPGPEEKKINAEEVRKRSTSYIPTHSRPQRPLLPHHPHHRLDLAPRV